jgi:hypothetical protein
MFVIEYDNETAELWATFEIEAKAIVTCELLNIRWPHQFRVKPI